MIKKFFILAVVSLLFIHCNIEAPYQRISGKTMGTTYSVIYQSNSLYQTEIDDLLTEINSQVSTYIPEADISRFNKSESTFKIDDTAIHFTKNWAKSQEVSRRTRGYFDPTVMPLINYWGFGYTEKSAREQIDSSEVDRIKSSVGIFKIQQEGRALIKPSADTELDFSAIAKGYAVDAIANLLSTAAVENYLVEIGGETYAKGVNADGVGWNIGLNTPQTDAALDAIELIVNVDEKGVATSGNYRNFYEVDGVKYGHTINPLTGYPSINELLGVTVIADDCITADAYATAFMTIGLKGAQSLVEAENLEACFFTGGENGSIIKTYSNGFIQYVRGE